MSIKTPKKLRKTPRISVKRPFDREFDSVGKRLAQIQGAFLTVPPNFQYQNEKGWVANQRFCSMKFLMYKRSSLVEQRFSF